MLRLLKKLQKITGIAIACVLVLVTALALAFTKKNDNEILKLSHFDSDKVVLDNNKQTIVFTPKTEADLGLLPDSGNKFRAIDIENEIVKSKAVGWELVGEKKRIIGVNYNNKPMLLQYKNGKKIKEYELKIDYSNFILVYNKVAFNTDKDVYEKDLDSFVCFLVKEDVVGKNEKEIKDMIREKARLSQNHMDKSLFYVNETLREIGLGQLMNDVMFESIDSLKNVAAISRGSGETKIQVKVFVEKPTTKIRTRNEDFVKTDFDEINPDELDGNIFIGFADTDFILSNNKIEGFKSQIKDYNAYDLFDKNNNLESTTKMVVKPKLAGGTSVNDFLELYFVYKRKNIKLNYYQENADNDDTTPNFLDNITARYCDEFNLTTNDNGFNNKKLTYIMKDEYSDEEFANLSNGAILNPSLNNKEKFTILRKRVKVEFNLNQPISQDGTTTNGTTPSNGELKFGQLIKNWPTKTSFTHRDYDFLSTDKKIGSNSENILSDVKEYKISIEDVNFDKITFKLNWKNKTRVKYQIRIYIENEVFDTGKRYNTGEDYKADSDYSTRDFSYFDGDFYTNGTADNMKTISQGHYFNDKIFSKRTKYLQNKADDTEFVGVGTEKDFLHFLHENSNLSQKELLIKGDGSTVFDIYYVRNRYTIKYTHYAEDLNGSYSKIPNDSAKINQEGGIQKIGGGYWTDKYFTCKSYVPFKSAYIDATYPGFEILDKDTLNLDKRYMGYNLVRAYLMNTGFIEKENNANDIVPVVTAGDIGEAYIRYADAWYGKVKRKRIKAYGHHPFMSHYRVVQKNGGSAYFDLPALKGDLPYSFIQIRQQIEQNQKEYVYCYLNGYYMNRRLWEKAIYRPHEHTWENGGEYLPRYVFGGFGERFHQYSPSPYADVYTFKYGDTINKPEEFNLTIMLQEVFNNSYRFPLGCYAINIYGRTTKAERLFSLNRLDWDSSNAKPYYADHYNISNILVDKYLVNYTDGYNRPFYRENEPNGVAYIVWHYFSWEEWSTSNIVEQKIAAAGSNNKKTIYWTE